MSTELSSTEAARFVVPHGAGLLAEARRACADVRHLLWFRSVSVRGRGLRKLPLVLAAITALAATVPAFAGAAQDADDVMLDVLVVMPSAMAAFLLLGVVSGIASGGGRELLSREHGVAYPVSPTTDHLGALLLTPLNVAWLVQAWVLLGGMAYGAGPSALWGAEVVMVLWIAAATAAAQAVAWTFETVRRWPHGEWVVRGVMAVVGVVSAVLFATGSIGDALDLLPTTQILVAGFAPANGDWLRFAVTTGLLALSIPVLVAVGAFAAHRAARRTPRDELRIESGVRSARPEPSSALAALMRVDRASVWRVVPMRRGMTVLAVGPGLVAIAGDLAWSSMTILPGLVVSGAALLFGVNVWALEGRGALWRESLPVDPGDVYDARLLVLLEWLLLGSIVTIGLGGLRAGLPDGSELAAILCTWLVVTSQVLSACMRWSEQRPFAVDLRSARATPAPPAVMVGYSARLAIATTLVGLVFGVLAQYATWQASLIIAIPFLTVSWLRILASRQRWLDPVRRVRIVSAVAG